MDIQNSILPLETLPRLFTNESLVQILSNTTSSHDGVLVYNEPSNTYVGVAYPYNMLFRRRPNLNATVGSVLFTPPYISPSTSVYEVLRQMVSLRLYTLPVMDKSDKPMGIVTAKNMLHTLLQDKTVIHDVIKNLQILEPMVADRTAKIKDIYSLMRKKQASRVIIQAENGTLEGILSRRDIYLALLSPAPNNRFRKQGGKNPSSFFDKEWITHLDYAAEVYMARPVIFAFEHESRLEMLNTLLMSNKNALVITNSNTHPVGVISIRSIILTLLSLQPTNEINTVVTDKNNILSAFRRKEVEKMLDIFSQKITQRLDIDKLELVIEPIRKNRQAIKLYDVKITLTPVSGERLRSYSKQYQLRDAVHDSTHKLLRQIDN